MLATSEAAARDAVEAVDVEYEPLEAVIDLEDALSDRVVIHDDLGTNKSYTWALKVEGTEGAVDAAFAAAAFTVRERYVQQRLLPMAMEPRAVVAVPQPFGGDITLYSATQIPHILKIMTAITLGIPEHQVRVVAPAVGGGFGSKLNVYAEELLCMALARKHGVPVRWNEIALGERPGHDPRPRPDPAHRPRRRRRRQAHRASGSACSATWAPTCSSSRRASRCSAAFLYAGVYDLPQAYDFECTSVFTTMTPTDAYRGAGRPEATYAIERAMDALAAQGRHRPARAAPAQLHRRRTPTRTRRGAAWSTTPATTTRRPPRPPSSSATTTLRRAPGGRRTSTARRSGSASASRRTSRCAASRRRGCSPR